MCRFGRRGYRWQRATRCKQEHGGETSGRQDESKLIAGDVSQDSGSRPAEKLPSQSGLGNRIFLECQLRQRVAGLGKFGLVPTRVQEGSIGDQRKVKPSQTLSCFVCCLKL